MPETTRSIVFSTIPHHKALYAVTETIDEIASLLDAHTLGEPEK